MTGGVVVRYYPLLSSSSQSDRFIAGLAVENIGSSRLKDEMIAVSPTSLLLTIRSFARSINAYMKYKRNLCILTDIKRLFPKGEVPSRSDLQCIQERQTGSTIRRPIAVSTGLCKYGFPQALVQHPVDTDSGTTQSGMLRLTCPNLVREIDAYEGSGAVKQFNNDVAVLEDVSTNYKEVNRDWQQIRNAYMTDAERTLIKEKLGPRADHFLNSGIIGVPMGRTDDVKCLHAHVADHLLRARNRVGELALQSLESRGAEIAGCKDCWQQCDKSVPKEKAMWWYTSIKNKSKLHKRRDQRRQQRERISEKIHSPKHDCQPQVE